MAEVKKHSKLGASIANRWLNCPGSVSLCEKAPPPRQSAYADEGTKAHDLAEQILKGKRPKGDAEMLGHVRTYTDFVKDLCLASGELLVETKVDLSYIDPRMFGTLDAAVVNLFGDLHIVDLKYGAGIAVEAKDNPQLAYYALGVANQYDFNFERVICHIVQPRAFHPEGAIRSWTMSIEELKDWEFIFKTAVQRLEKYPEVVAGDHCKFCPATVICPAVNERALDDAKLDFAPMTPQLPHPNDLEPAQISAILKKAEVVENWISEVKDYAFDLMNRGGTVEGFKLVEKRSIRKWEDESKVEEALKDFEAGIVYDLKLKSPAQMEKNAAAFRCVEQYIVQQSSGLTLVPESDKRPAVNQLALDFKSEEIPQTEGVKNAKGKNKRSKKSNDAKVSG